MTKRWHAYRSRVNQLKAAFKKTAESPSKASSSAKVHRNGGKDEPESKPGKESPIARVALQWRVLLQRSWRQIKRDKGTTVARIMSNVSSAIIFGSIYWRMGRAQEGIQNRMGLLQVDSPAGTLQKLIYGAASLCRDYIILA